MSENGTGGLQKWVISCFVIATAVVTILSAIMAYSAWRVSQQQAELVGMAADIRNTNNRIDEVFPQLTNQARDVGNLLGEVRVTNTKLDDANMRLDNVVLVNDHQAELIGDLAKSNDDLKLSINDNTEQVTSRLDALDLQFDGLKLQLKGLKESRVDDGSMRFQQGSSVPIAKVYDDCDTAKLAEIVKAAGVSGEGASAAVEVVDFYAPNACALGRSDVSMVRGMMSDAYGALSGDDAKAAVAAAKALSDSAGSGCDEDASALMVLDACSLDDVQKAISGQ